MWERAEGRDSAFDTGLEPPSEENEDTRGNMDRNKPGIEVR